MEKIVLKKRIAKGQMAENAKEYVFCLLENYKKEIMQSLEKGENIRKLHGMAYIIKKIEQDIIKDISHKDDAVTILNNGEKHGTNYK